MTAAILDIVLTSEFIDGNPLPAGSEDLETEITPPPAFGDALVTGTSAVQTASRQSFGTVTFSARRGSKRYRMLNRFWNLARITPGFQGFVYSASGVQDGSAVQGRLVPMQAGPRNREKSASTVEFTATLHDYVDQELPTAFPQAE